MKKSKYKTKKELLKILRSETGADTVRDTMIDFFTTSCFGKGEKEFNVSNISNLRFLLKGISDALGPQFVRVAAWEFFKDNLTYEMYQRYMTNEKNKNEENKIRIQR